MTDTNDAQLLRTPLADEHAALGATLTDFGGWQMPLRYGSELAEHHAVRQAAGLFDLSHMGEIWVTGTDAAVFLNTVLVGNLANIAVSQAKYTLLCNDRGGIVDDLLVYRLEPQRFLVVPNAGNAARVAAEFAARAGAFDVQVHDATAELSLIAVQGPNASEALRAHLPELFETLFSDVPVYRAAELNLFDERVILARTGYTGEDGFELIVPNAIAVRVWRALLAARDTHGLVPAGLAARDSLRLEAGMPLYGNELNEDTTPFDVGLRATVVFAKPEEFVGREALDRARAAGAERVLVGLQGLGRRAARSGYAVFAGDTEIGVVTSGQPSPTLGYPIALARVDALYSEIGAEVTVDLRGKREPFTVVRTPFYNRAR